MGRRDDGILDTVTDLFHDIRGAQRGARGVLRENRGLGKEAGRNAGGVMDIPAGWFTGRGDMHRAEARDLRAQNRVERYQNDGDYGGRHSSYGRRGRYDQPSPAEMQMHAQAEYLRGNEEVQEELERQGLTYKHEKSGGFLGMGGNEPATDLQVLAAARQVEYQNAREGYMQDLNAAKDLPAIQQNLKAAGGDLEGAWEAYLRQHNPGVNFSDADAQAALNRYRAQFQQGVSHAPAAPTQQPQSTAPTPLSPTSSRDDASSFVASAAATAPVPMDPRSASQPAKPGGFDTFGGLYQEAPGKYHQDPKQVQQLQRMLNVVSGGHLAEDGKYGTNTAASVREMRESMGLAPGAADPDFLAALSQRYAERTGGTRTAVQAVSLSAVQLPSGVTGGVTTESHTPPPPTPQSPSRGDFKEPRHTP